MTRMNLVPVAALAGAFFWLEPVQAYEAPWCAAIELSKGSVYWDCHIARSKIATAEAIFWQAIVASVIRAHTTLPTLQHTGVQRNAALPAVAQQRTCR